MSKHTYGFHKDRDKDDAIAAAIQMAKADGLIGDKPYTTEVVETDEHIMNEEFVVVVRVAE